MTQEQVKSLILSHDKDEEFAHLEYPNHAEALVSFLETHGLSIEETDIEEKTGEPYIDGDGYCGINSILSIPSLSLEVSIVAFQHTGWDFYFDQLT